MGGFGRRKWARPPPLPTRTSLHSDKITDIESRKTANWRRYAYERAQATRDPAMKAAYMSEIARRDLEDYKDGQDAAFEHRFQAFLTGKTNAVDISRTPWYKSIVTTSNGAKLDRTHHVLATHPKIHAYLQSFIDKRAEFRRIIEHLRIFGPLDIGTNEVTLDAAYLWYKYVIDGGGMDSDDYLKDFETGLSLMLSQYEQLAKQIRAGTASGAEIEWVKRLWTRNDVTGNTSAALPASLDSRGNANKRFGRDSNVKAIMDEWDARLVEARQPSATTSNMVKRPFTAIRDGNVEGRIGKIVGPTPLTAGGAEDNINDQIVAAVGTGGAGGAQLPASISKDFGKATLAMTSQISKSVQSAMQDIGVSVTKTVSDMSVELTKKMTELSSNSFTSLEKQLATNQDALKKAFESITTELAAAQADEKKKREDVNAAVMANLGLTKTASDADVARSQIELKLAQDHMKRVEAQREKLEKAIEANELAQEQYRNKVIGDARDYITGLGTRVYSKHAPEMRSLRRMYTAYDTPEDVKEAVRLMLKDAAHYDLSNVTQLWHFTTDFDMEAYFLDFMRSMPFDEQREIADKLLEHNLVDGPMWRHILGLDDSGMVNSMLKDSKKKIEEKRAKEYAASQAAQATPPATPATPAAPVAPAPTGPQSPVDSSQLLAEMQRTLAQARKFNADAEARWRASLAHSPVPASPQPAGLPFTPPSGNTNPFTPPIGGSPFTPQPGMQGRFHTPGELQRGRQWSSPPMDLGMTPTAKPVLPPTPASQKYQLMRDLVKPEVDGKAGLDEQNNLAHTMALLEAAERMKSPGAVLLSGLIQDATQDHETGGSANAVGLAESLKRKLRNDPAITADLQDLAIHLFGKEQSPTPFKDMAYDLGLPEAWADQLEQVAAPIAQNGLQLDGLLKTTGEVRQDLMGLSAAATDQYAKYYYDSLIADVNQIESEAIAAVSQGNRADLNDLNVRISGITRDMHYANNFSPRGNRSYRSPDPGGNFPTLAGASPPTPAHQGFAPQFTPPGQQDAGLDAYNAVRAAFKSPSSFEAYNPNTVYSVYNQGKLVARNVQGVAPADTNELLAYIHSALNSTVAPEPAIMTNNQTLHDAVNEFVMYENMARSDPSAPFMQADADRMRAARAVMMQYGVFMSREFGTKRPLRPPPIRNAPLNVPVGIGATLTPAVGAVPAIPPAPGTPAAAATAGTPGPTVTMNLGTLPPSAAPSSGGLPSGGLSAFHAQGPAPKAPVVVPAPPPTPPSSGSSSSSSNGNAQAPPTPAPPQGASPLPPAPAAPSPGASSTVGLPSGGLSAFAAQSGGSSSTPAPAATPPAPPPKPQHLRSPQSTVGLPSGGLSAVPSRNSGTIGLPSGGLTAFANSGSSSALLPSGGLTAVAGQGTQHTPAQQAALAKLKARHAAAQQAARTSAAAAMGTRGPAQSPPSGKQANIPGSPVAAPAAPKYNELESDRIRAAMEVTMNTGTWPTQTIAVYPPGEEFALLSYKDNNGGLTPDEVARMTELVEQMDKELTPKK